MKVRKVEGEKLQRLVTIFERQAAAQAALNQISSELHTACLMLDIDEKRHGLDLQTGEITEKGQSQPAEAV